MQIKGPFVVKSKDGKNSVEILNELLPAYVKGKIKPKPQTIHQNIPQYKEPIKSGDIKGYKDFFN